MTIDPNNQVLRLRKKHAPGGHTQPDATLAVDFQYLHPDVVAFAQLVADLLDALLTNLGNVYEPILAGQDVDEGAELIHQAHQLDPLNYKTSLMVAVVLLSEGRLKEASVYFRLSFKQATGESAQPIVVS